MYRNPCQSRIADTHQVDRLHPRSVDPMIRRSSADSSVDSSVDSSDDSSVDPPNARVITPLIPEVSKSRADKRILPPLTLYPSTVPTLIRLRTSTEM